MVTLLRMALYNVACAGMNEAVRGLRGVCDSDSFKLEDDWSKTVVAAVDCDTLLLKPGNVASESQESYVPVDGDPG